MKLAVLIAAAAALTGCSRTVYHSEELLDLQAEHSKEAHIKIGLTSLFVQDQASALRFYTEVIGFVKKADIPLGEYRWLTVASPEGPEGVELLLEPNSHPAAKAYQEAIYADGIPATSFQAADVEREYERLRGLGVEFKTPPTDAGTTTIAVFNDTCGNLIQLHQG